LRHGDGGAAAAAARDHKNDKQTHDDGTEIADMKEEKALHLRIRQWNNMEQSNMIKFRMQD